jgi:hypothetical protein
LFWGDGFVGYDDIGWEFSRVVLPGDVIIDGPEGIGEISSD